MAPHGLRRRLGEMRQPLVAAAGGDDAEARGARPIDEVADQRRLVAESEAVNDAGLGGLARQQRAAERVGFDGDVDDVLALTKRVQAMFHRGDRVAGAFDDDVDRGMRERAPASRRRHASCPWRSASSSERAAKRSGAQPTRSKIDDRAGR